MTKDQITKESEVLEAVLKYLEYASDICPKCGSCEIKVNRTCSDRPQPALPRKRRCNNCDTRWVTEEFVVFIQ